jgi:hypothetical protein
MAHLVIFKGHNVPPFLVFGMLNPNGISGVHTQDMLQDWRLIWGVGGRSFLFPAASLVRTQIEFTILPMTLGVSEKKNKLGSFK